MKWKNAGRYLSGIEKFKEEDHNLKKHFKSNFLFPPKPKSSVTEGGNDSDKENKKVSEKEKFEDGSEEKESEVEKIQKLLEKTKTRQVSHLNLDNPIIFDIF